MKCREGAKSALLRNTHSSVNEERLTPKTLLSSSGPRRSGECMAVGISLLDAGVELVSSLSIDALMLTDGSFLRGG